MHLNPPTPIDLYFTSERTDDTEILGEIFANDAVVEDESATHRGLEAIKAWKREGKQATGYTIEAQNVRQHDDQTIVTAQISGRFPGSPVTLTYAFTLLDERIIKLEIQ